MKMNWLMLLLLGLLVLLQAQLWIGDGSIGQQRQLKQQIAEQEQRIKALEERNQKIIREIESLSEGTGTDAGLEERARSELGMIEENEVFYMVIESEAADGKDQPSSDSNSDSK